ncbi:MAG: head-tail connector protein [Bacteroides sp.]|nr:head-tail connector protein [Eubacterium sp.]MCM1419111.1 head-tail connector protein [Roseburia sp.]MCM1463497.1 head-tail connector protein [Bacteroides sp.]
MAIGNSYLTSVRKYMRLTTTAHDQELKDLIHAARADLVLGGVLEAKAEDEKDPLIKRAVATYVKAEFGLDNEDSEKYRASYREQRNGLALSDGYIKATEEE